MIRIQEGDSCIDAVVKLAEGIIGAVRVLAELVEVAPSIDPENPHGKKWPLFALDHLGIYGSAILVLFNDWCGEDIMSTYAALRARQLDLVAFEAKDLQVRGEPCRFDPATIVERVRAASPLKFAPEATIGERSGLKNCLSHVN